MVETMEWIVEKKEYVIPTVELYRLGSLDVLCMSDETNDNEFDASDLGSF